MKPVKSIAIVYARDWGMSSALVTEADAKKVTMPTGWLIGWLIEETKECIRIAHEYFDDEDELDYRYISIIPQETIMFKRIIPIKELF